MWPKMLIDLLPHFARLIPMADRFLTTRSASDKAQEAALAALGESVRGELGKANEAHSGLRRQIQEQTTHIAELALDVTRVRLGVEGAEARVAKLEGSVAAMEDSLAEVKGKAGSAVKLLGAAVGLLIIAVALLVILVVRSGR